MVDGLPVGRWAGRRDLAGRYTHLFRAQARAQAQYRASFGFDLVSSLVFGCVDLAAVVVLFGVGGTLGGFDRAAGLLMATLAAAGFALADLCVGNIETVRTYVRTGRLDAVLLRPLGAFGQLVAMDFAPRRAGRFLLSAGLVPVTAVWAGVAWTPANVALTVLTPLCGAVLFGSVFVAAATVAFWWIDSGEFSASFTYGGRDFTSYPLTVYGTVFRRLFAFGLGFGFAGYYPALTLLGRPDPLGAPTWFGWAPPAVAAVAAGLAALAWRTGLSRYRSTGS